MGEENFVKCQWRRDKLNANRGGASAPPMGKQTITMVWLPMPMFLKHPGLPLYKIFNVK